MPYQHDFFRFIALCALFFPTLLLGAPESFDKPERVISKKIKGEDQQELEYRCHVYREFVVVAVEDPNLEQSEVNVRFLSQPADRSQGCAEEFKGKSYRLKRFVGKFWGVSGRLIFTSVPNPYGVLKGFGVYEANTALKLWTDERHIKMPFEVSREGNKTSLSYFHPLKSSCVPGKDSSECWKKILSENNIKNTSGVKAPDCKKIKSATAQITTKVKIADLSKPELEFINGEATCDPGP